MGFKEIQDALRQLGAELAQENIYLGDVCLRLKTEAYARFNVLLAQWAPSVVSPGPVLSAPVQLSVMTPGGPIIIEHEVTVPLRHGQQSLRYAVPPKITPFDPMSSAPVTQVEVQLQLHGLAALSGEALDKIGECYGIKRIHGYSTTPSGALVSEPDEGFRDRLQKALHLFRGANSPVKAEDPPPKQEEIAEVKKKRKAGSQWG